MKYVKIAYFDMLFNMSFYVDMHYKQVRIWILQSSRVAPASVRFDPPQRMSTGAAAWTLQALHSRVRAGRISIEPMLPVVL